MNKQKEPKNMEDPTIIERLMGGKRLATVTITPKIAIALLELNNLNRPLVERLDPA